MENWLVRARKASNLSSEECAAVLGCTHDEMAYFEARPGEVTLNDVGLLLRCLPDEGASIVVEMLFEMTAANRWEGEAEPCVD